MASVEVVVETHRRRLEWPATPSMRSAARPAHRRRRQRPHQGEPQRRPLHAPTPETRQAVDAHGVRILSRLELNPGRYAIRVAGVNDGDAAKGSVHSTLDVPDFSKGPLTMSGLALSSAAEQKRPTTGSDTNWAQRFTEPPTATRAFAASDELSVFDEIYRNDKKLGTVTVTTTVRSESDDVVFRQEQKLGGATAAASGSASDSIHTKIPLRICRRETISSRSRRARPRT